MPLYLTIQAMLASRVITWYQARVATEYRKNFENISRLAHIFIETHIIDNHGKLHDSDDKLDRLIWKISVRDQNIPDLSNCFWGMRFF